MTRDEAIKLIADYLAKEDQEKIDNARQSLLGVGTVAVERKNYTQLAEDAYAGILAELVYNEFVGKHEYAKVQNYGGYPAPPLPPPPPPYPGR